MGLAIDTKAFETSKVGRIALSLVPPAPQAVADGEGPDASVTAAPTEEKPKLSSEEQRRLDETTHLKVLETRALLARVRVLPETSGPVVKPQIKPAVSGLLDRDLTEALEDELDPSLVIAREREKTTSRLQELLSDPVVLGQYADIYNHLNAEIKTGRALANLYHSDPSLSPTEKLSIVRQLSRIIKNLIDWCKDEIQNIHNQVKREKRGYRESDRAIFKKLKEYMAKCERELDNIKSSDPEAQIQLRRDEIELDRAILSRRLPEDVAKRNRLLVGSDYIVTPSREALLFGDGKTPDQNIMTALRQRKNVELFGPTGTGKTQVAIHAAKLFSGKDPIIISGNRSTGKSEFTGKTVGLNTRDEGALISCMEEGRVVIVDEDNRVDPSIQAVIKLALGFKVGSVYIHPETKRIIVVQPGFGVIVTRNEKGKHHDDRFELPPEYRREFVFGSLEVGYFPPQEIYDRFLVPKLCNDDGSMPFTEAEVGGDVDDPNKRSPLLAFVLASEKIQKVYKENKIKDGVFESGFLIGIMDSWHEQHENTGCSFITYLETALVRFTKRAGLGNPARKKIIQILIEEGFFASKNENDFETQDEGKPVTNDELNGFRSGAGMVTPPAAPASTGGRRAAASRGASSVTTTPPVFMSIDPTASKLDARAVAMLDPFKVRRIEIRPHPLQAKVAAFKRLYTEFCLEKGIQPVPFSAHDFGDKRPAIIRGITEYVDMLGLAITNANVIVAMLGRLASTLNDEQFLDEFFTKYGPMLKKLKA